MKNEEEIRINKYIAHNTKYSRREADELIKSGKVKVKGKVVTDLSTKITPKDKVFIHDRFVHKKSEWTVLVYHKQKGELVTKKDDRERKTIYDNLSKRYRHFIPIGRLDYASEGLLLLTDSSNVATILMTSPLERVYYLKVKGNITEEIEEAMKKGLIAEDATKGAHSHSKITSMEFAPFVEYKIIKNLPTYSRLRVTITEGKNRELRRFFGYFDREVTDLKRVEFGGVSLDGLKAGKHRFLTKSEYHSLHTYINSTNK